MVGDYGVLTMRRGNAETENMGKDKKCPFLYG